MDISACRDSTVWTVDEGKTVTSSSSELFAALDLGTNSCRMFIARQRNGDIDVVDAFSRTIFLGDGLERYGTLSRAAISRGLNALRVCRRKLESHGVTKTRLVATEACRRARNGPSFIRKIREETGLSLEVIDPKEEAWLAVIGCAPHVASDTDLLLVIDIGGGSTELVWIDFSDCPGSNRFKEIARLDFGGERKVNGNGRTQVLCSATDRSPASRARVVDWISVPFGVATLSTRYADVADVAARYALMSCFFEEELVGLESSVGTAPDFGFQIIGTSGTVTSLAASHLGLKRYDRTRVHGLNLTAREIEAVVGRFIRPLSNGNGNHPVGRWHRQTLVISGAAIIQAILRVWPCERLTAADCGLREGLLYSQMIAAGMLDRLAAAK